MEQNNRDEIEIDLKQIFFLLLDRLFIILTCGVLVGAIAFAYTKFMIAPTYQSVTTTCVVTTAEGSNVTSTDFVTGNYMSKDYVEIVKSRSVYETVIEGLELDITVSQLNEMVSVENVTDTRIIEITVTDTDPYRAQKIADAIRVASEIRIKEVIPVQGVEKVDAANLPSRPVAPSMTKNVIIGALIGMFLAVAIIVIRFILDDTIKSPEDIEKYLGLSTLASIPMMSEAEYDGEKSSKSKGNTKKKPVKKPNSNRPKREVVR